MKILSSETEKNFSKLNAYLSTLDTAAVSFSGGVDSSLLLYSASKISGLKVIAYTVKTPLITGQEIVSAIAIAKQFNIEHKLIELDILSFDIVAANSIERCYHCKKIILTEIISAAAGQGITAVLEGSHSGDISDYRPGLKAIRELGVISPLKNAGFDKNKIYELSAHLDLPTSGKESYPCLATRIPYGTRLTSELLKRAELAERILASCGFRQIRARIHGDILRIEITADMIPEIASSPVREKICDALTRAGFTYITLDLKGYRTGSMNLNTGEKK